MASKVTTKDLARALYESTKDGSDINARLKNFVELLAKYNMISKADDIIEKYKIIYNTDKNITEATVHSRHTLSKKQTEKIEEMIKKKYSGNKIEITNDTDEKLLGGIKITIDDEVTDYSLQAQLQNLQTHLTN